MKKILLLVFLSILLLSGCRKLKDDFSDIEYKNAINEIYDGNAKYNYEGKLKYKDVNLSFNGSIDGYKFSIKLNFNDIIGDVPNRLKDEYETISSPVYYDIDNDNIYYIYNAKPSFEISYLRKENDIVTPDIKAYFVKTILFLETEYSLEGLYSLYDNNLVPFNDIFLTMELKLDEFNHFGEIRYFNEPLDIEMKIEYKYDENLRLDFPIYHMHTDECKKYISMFDKGHYVDKYGCRYEEMESGIIELEPHSYDEFRKCSYCGYQKEIND